jgi:hypothetical protein
MGFGEPFHQIFITAIGTSESDLIEELRAAEVKGSQSFPAGFLSQGTGEKGLSDTRGTRDQKVLMVSDPVAGGKIEEDRFFDAPGCFEVNIFDAGLEFKLGLLEKSFEASVFLPGPLTVNEDTKAFIEGEILEGRLLGLFFKGLGHAEKFHAIEFVKGLFVEHGGSSSFHW